MQREISKLLIVIGLCAGVLFSPNVSWADEVSDLVQELADSGMSADTIDNLLSSPGDTLGQRASDMLHNGTITERQYEKVYNHFMALPDEKRQLIKNAYDKGYSAKVYDAVVDIGHQKLDDASLRDHIKDLRQQGLSREQIAQRLYNEGVSKDHLKDLGYGFIVEPSRPEHAKDLRDTGAEHQMDLGHEKYQNVKNPPSRIEHAKDVRVESGRSTEAVQRRR